MVRTCGSTPSPITSPGDQLFTSGASEGSATAAATTILARRSKDSKNSASAVVLSKLLQYTTTRP